MSTRRLTIDHGSRATRRASARRRRHRLLPPLLALGLFGLGALAVALVVAPLALPSTCEFATADGSRVPLAPEQAGNAATIAAVAVRLDLPDRAALVAIATALQESKLRNLAGGDRDSLGLFQQRPSQGWGTPEQIRDPVYASERFYLALEKVPGWESMPLTEAAQRVQRSGFPTAYAAHEDQAQIYAQALTGARPRAVACRLTDDSARQATGATQPTDVATALKREMGVVSQVSGARLEFSSASPQNAAGAAGWAVAQADRFAIIEVRLGAQSWRRTPVDDALRWSPPEGTAPPTTVRIELAAR